MGEGVTAAFAAIGMHPGISAPFMDGGRTGGIAQDITQHEGSLVYVFDGGEDTQDALTAVGPSQDWGVKASWVFSRLFSGRGWMRGLDVEVGENRG